MKFQLKYILSLLLLSFIFYISCSENEYELKIVDTILNDSSSYFYIDLKMYKDKNPNLPIGIFDSGTGGLTVLDAIVNFDRYNNDDRSYLERGDSKRDFAEESFIYLADQANMPYGNYGMEDKSLLLKEHVVKDMQFLMGNKYYQRPEDDLYCTDKSPIKAMVIACNTATAYAKTDIENFMNDAGVDLKVIGVIGAGVRAALENQEFVDDPYAIAVMATAGTVESNGYVEEIMKQLNEKQIDANISIYQQAGVGLAGAIDGINEFIDNTAEKPRSNYKGPSDKDEKLKIDLNILERYNFDWSGNKMLFDGNTSDPSNIQINSIDNYISFHIVSLLEQIIAKEESPKLTTIILGCTHYPFYTDIFEKKLEFLRDYKEDGKNIYQDVIGENIEFIDPAFFTAKELYDYLNEQHLFNTGSIYDSEFYISMPNISNENVRIDIHGNFEYEYKYGREVNEIQEYVKRVPFSRRNIPKLTDERLKGKIPFTYSLIRNFNLINPKTEFLEELDKLD
jgi:glutamate racemase